MADEHREDISNDLLLVFKELRDRSLLVDVVVRYADRDGSTDTMLRGVIRGLSRIDPAVFIQLEHGSMIEWLNTAAIMSISYKESVFNDGER